MPGNGGGANWQGGAVDPDTGMLYVRSRTLPSFNLNSGDQVRMIPNGKPPANVLNNPALKAAGIDASNWGGIGGATLLITKTLLVAGSSDLRFIDKATGAVIHEMPLGANVGPTMTYLVNGRQFLVAVVAGQRGQGAELVALAVPN